MTEKEARAWRLILALDRVHRSKNLPFTTVFRNLSFQASFIFCGDNKWLLSSPHRSYEVVDPSLDYLLEKYARLMDPDFRSTVGDYSLYDTEEDYVKTSQRYVQAHRDRLLTGFIHCLRSALGNSSVT
ncbi:MAG: hypothetical protein A3B99_00180 [Candidatus Yanofskybacteria bacterium RIFCSPHIGHO2_02_FULL_44_12b]|uniref:Uncharacterized protein n=1 Tax=Candidatus Yanofskybacteria bacterium RIFCSPLOWO2_01_FULL_44_22 TaxID=1802697 RepID=A0A1F8GKG8_9BACT|nr:MAG: hypothetical protein A2659_01625 [Candidatus Yanofskybacteria bacterium RIFCSPHIGHO2_01_FULL_44_24]OGN14762.1 MAG: hypothetical protein A3B99_00180 [Candidatus Yanofskybacteria bacterium RIFCSPHIGHO2_02_FULL_44_12b]OGN25895.1 MAG: hypothetical protein A2925_02545 [Candidatus Yanofskybacteria bacterium RIFCSPLOWO2_01_FULL_44_22]